ncbi:MAG: hypothetical protein ACT4P6_09320 [Gemmatimonadaceae bacterium]
MHRPGQGLQLITALNAAGGWSTAQAINNSGKLLGVSTTAAGEFRYFTWTSAGGKKNETGAGSLGAVARSVTKDESPGLIASTVDHAHSLSTKASTMCYPSC